MSLSRKRLLGVLVAVAALLAVPAPAGAFRVDAPLGPQPGNPADRLATLPPDPEQYDRATHCSRKPRPGVTSMVNWLQRNVRGVFWGSYRCEKWGAHEASLHAEGRAIDWHLDAADPGDAREARRLISYLLAPDLAGTPRALARRMGVEEIIWDCSYWAAGMEEFGPYSPCYSRHGRLRKRVDKTIAHRDHVHLGLSKAGAAGRTSFWR